MAGHVAPPGNRQELEAKQLKQGGVCVSFPWKGRPQPVAQCPGLQWRSQYRLARFRRGQVARPPRVSPPQGGGGVKGLCSSRICTPPENPATSTRLTKDTRGLRGGCDARGCYRGMDECTLRSRAEQEGSGPASPGRRRACVRRDNGSELQARPSLAGLVEAAGVPG